MIQIGDWKVIPETNQVENHQKAFFLKPRIMRLLEYLLQRAGQIVTKDELMEAVWEDRIVTDNLLTKSISELRQILAEDFSGLLEIETIRSVGYQLQCRGPIHFGEMPVETGVAAQLSAKTKAGYWKGGGVIGGLLMLLVGWMYLGHEASVETIYEADFSPVTSTLGMEWQAAISPDGANLVYAWRKDQSQPFYLYTRHLESVKAKRLTNQEGLFELNPVWSPDGQKVAFLRVKEKGFYDLQMVPLAGGEETWLAQLDFHLINSGILWLENPDRLIFSGKKEKEDAFGIYSYYWESGAVDQLTTPADSLYGDYLPSKLDDQQLIFARAGLQHSLLNPEAPGDGQIFLFETSTRRLKPIATFTGEMTGLAYAPPLGKLLAWVAKEDGYAYDLNSYSLGGEQAAITGVSSYRPVGIVAHPHQPYFITESWLSRPDIYRLGDTSEQRYLHSTHWDWHPRYTQDGQKVAFLTTRSGSMEVWLADQNRPDQATPISTFQSRSINWMSLSPDAEWGLLQGIIDGQEGLFKLEVKTKKAAPFKIGKYEYAFPEFSPDGKSIFYASSRSGDWQIWQCDLDGNNDRMITQHGGYKPLPVLDSAGLHLYYTTFEGNQLFNMQLPSGEIQQALPNGASFDKMNVAITSKGIYYYSWENGQCLLKYFDFETQITVKVRALDNIVPEVPSLAVSPRGTILIARSEGIMADLVKVHFMRQD